MQYFQDNKRHLVCVPYSIENLHLMAKDLDINKCWFHKNHYDIPKLRKLNVPVISSKEVLEIIKNKLKYFSPKRTNI